MVLLPSFYKRSREEHACGVFGFNDLSMMEGSQFLADFQELFDYA